MGRNPKKIVDLKAAGTYRKDRHAARLEASADLLSEVPPPPEQFDSEHRAKWQEVCGNLVAFNIMTNADLSAVRQYVELEIALFKVFAQLTAEGYTLVVETKGGPVPKANPLIRVYKDLDGAIKPLREQFGFTPRSRQGINVAEPKTKTSDPFTAIMAKAKVG